MKALVAEFLGTFILCLVGILGGHFGNSSLAHGLILVGIIPTFAGISGSHFNPAVTLGMLVTKNIKIDAALTYWAAQLLGGIVAALAAKGMVANVFQGGAAATDVSTLFLCEALLTMVLVAVVMVVVRRKASPQQAGVAVGLTLAALIMAGASISGAALNPARALGPMVATSVYSNLWVYMVAPLVGGAVGALVLNWLDSSEA